MKSELLRKALMAKMAVGGDVEGGDDPIKSAKKVTKIPEGYVEVKDAKGNVVKNEAGEVLYKKESKKPTTSTKPFTKPEEGKLKQNIQTSQKKPIDTGLTPKVIKKDMPKKKETSEVDYLYLGQESTEDKDKSSQQIEKKAETKVPENKWGAFWGGERRWSRASQGMSPIYDKSGNKMFYESIDIPAQWDAKNNRWETAGGWGKPTTLYGVDVNGKLEVFDPSSSPISYTEKGDPYYDYEKLSKPTGMYGKQSDAALKEGPLRVLHGYGAAQTQPFKGEYDPSLDVKQSINRIGDGNIYNPVQPKKKGGIVARYVNGTPPEGVDPNIVSAEKNIMGGTKLKDISSEDKLGLLNIVAPMASGGLDALDRKDGRSSIAGQAGVGALKGATTGLQLGMNPALMAATGGLSAPIGAAIGAAGFGVKSAIEAKKEKKERQNVAAQETFAKATEAQESMNPNRGPVKIESYNAKDYKKGLAGLFANGGSVKQMPNSVNKINYATGGTIKGAGTGTSDSIVTDINKKGIPEGSFITPAKNNEMAKGIRGMVLGQNPNKVAEFKKGGTPKSDKVAVSNGEHLFTPTEKEKIIKYLGKEILEKLAPEAEENEMEKNKGGEMIKRADGSYSKRGLWDNIRANIGSGKKPTPEMLKQEKEIKSELKKGGYVVKRSSERKGKTHVVIGPDGTKKYFGDSKLGQHPNDPARKKAFYARHEKNLKKNPYFRAFARETWAEGGTVGSKMNKEMLEKELIKKANGDNVAVADKTKVKSPNVSSEALKKLKDKQKQIDERGKKYDEEIAKGNTIVVIPNKPTIESKKFKSTDSTYFYPNAYVSPTEGYKYTKVEVGGKYKGNVKENPKDVYMSNPNAVIRQDSSEYARLRHKNGGNVAVADKTKVKSPNVYEGKMPEKKEQPLKWETFAFYHLPEKGPEREMFEKIKKESATKKAKGGTLTKAKAKEILHDKSVHGKPLTDKQRKYFGWVAGGKKNMGGTVGKYAMGGNVNRDWDWG